MFLLSPSASASSTRMHHIRQPRPTTPRWLHSLPFRGMANNDYRWRPTSRAYRVHSRRQVNIFLFFLMMKNIHYEIMTLTLKITLKYRAMLKSWEQKKLVTPKSFQCDLQFCRCDFSVLEENTSVRLSVWLPM